MRLHVFGTYILGEIQWQRKAMSNRCLESAFHPMAIMWQLAVKIILAGYHNQPTQIMYPRFEPQEGRFLVTSSYDMTAKVWSSRYFKPFKTCQLMKPKLRL